MGGKCRLNEIWIYISVLVGFHENNISFPYIRRPQISTLFWDFEIALCVSHIRSSERWSSYSFLLSFLSKKKSCAPKFIQGSRHTCGMAERNHLDPDSRTFFINCVWNVNTCPLHFFLETMAGLWSLPGSRPVLRGRRPRSPIYL